MKAFRFCVAAAVTFVSVSSLHAQSRPSAGLSSGDRVAVLGDSITEQKNYSALIEDYLLACQPAAGLRVTQFGWGGETTWGLVPRMDNDVLWFKPTVATIAYGMNDGGYGGVDPKRLEDYKTNTTAIITKLKAAGTRLIVVGGPGAVDADKFRTFFAQGPEAAKVYNKTLKTFGDAAEQVAKDQGVDFADLHDIMADAMEKFKRLHPGDSFVGNDGIHPDNVGHAVMAYAFLKAMGCDGDLGAIRIDLVGHQAEAAGGHRIISTDGNTFTVESSRYPFQAKKGGSATEVRAAMDLVPFQQELNRFTLTVTGVPEGKQVKLTWTEMPAEGASDGPAVTVSKTFDAAALKAGINLAAEFDTTPFEHAWGRLDNAVHAKQDFETLLTKKWLHSQQEWSQQMPQAADAVHGLADKGKQIAVDLQTITAAAVRPVKHVLRLEVQ